MSSSIRARLSAARLQPLGRRLLHFWFVWTALLFVHEGGHAYAALQQGLGVQRVTVGLGPELWHAGMYGVDVVVRLVPLAGLTTFASAAGLHAPHGDIGWLGHAGILSAGIIATMLLALATGVVIALRERRRGVRSVWARAMAADAIVLSVFNLLPVPPLDGGRAALDALAAWRGAPLSGDALFWVQVSGLALAVVPMALWTRWTARIDRFAMRWRAPVDGPRAARAFALQDSLAPGLDDERSRTAA